MKQFLCTFISIAALFMGTSCDDEDEKTVPGFDTLDVSSMHSCAILPGTIYSTPKRRVILIRIVFGSSRA